MIDQIWVSFRQFLHTLDRYVLCFETLRRALGGQNVKAEGDEPTSEVRDLVFVPRCDADKDLSLLPLLVYIFTHELVHIVRFCNFYQRYDISGRFRDIEEGLVHETTFDILKNSSLRNMEYILDSYKMHRPELCKF